MRVCLLGAQGDFTESTGHGVLTYMYYLLKELQRIRPSGIQVVKKECEPLPFLHNAFTVAARSVLEDFSSYDIVHLLDIRPIFRVRYGNAISITTVHDFRPITTPDLDSDRYGSLRGAADLRLVRLPAITAALRSDFLTANSTQTRDEAISLGFDKSRVFVTNLGIDKRYTKSSPRKRRGQLFKVGYIGGMAKSKNVDFAIKAFRMTNNKDSVMEIWGARGGPGYENAVEARGGDKHIRFMGFVPEERKIATYDSFGVFVYPSKYEGFGIPILEAQARGLPVIICRESRIAKEVGRYCIKARDAAHMAEIIGCIKDNGYNNKERKRVMRYARGFTWKKMARETIGVYRKAYKEKSRR